MFELPPMFLALAFIPWALAAWFLGRRNGAARTVRLPRDYYVGLDHLINDRFDHAAEIFSRMARRTAMPRRFSSPSGACSAAAARSTAPSRSIHACAGRAARRCATAPLSQLALDYQSAGLMDRAERVLEEVECLGGVSPRRARSPGRHLRGAGRLGQGAAHLPRAAAGGTGRAAPGGGALPVRARRAGAAAGRGRARRNAAAPGRAATSRSCRARRHAGRAHRGGRRAMPRPRCTLYLHALRGLPGAGARDHSARCCSSPSASRCAVIACSELGRRLRGSGRVSAAAARVDPRHGRSPRRMSRRLPQVNVELGAGIEPAVGSQLPECAPHPHRRCRRPLPVR